MKRIVIVGGPRTGKTTLAARIAAGAEVRHTDDLIADHDWSGASEAAAKWFGGPDPVVVEGVATARALRKWMAANPGDAKPCDQVFVTVTTKVETTSRQDAMGKGVATVLREIEPELLRRGVRVERVR